MDKLLKGKLILISNKKDIIKEAIIYFKIKNLTKFKGVLLDFKNMKDKDLLYLIYIKYPKSEIPKRNNIIKTNNTNNKNATWAIMLFESRNSCVALTYLFVVN